MDERDFLTALGWPGDRLGEAGQARWSGASADGISVTQALLERSEDGAVIAAVSVVSLAKTESLLRLEARFVSGQFQAIKANAGDPPEAIEAGDAKDLFAFLSRGLGELKFVPKGPISSPRPAQASPAGSNAL